MFKIEAFSFGRRMGVHAEEVATCACMCGSEFASLELLAVPPRQIDVINNGL